MANSWGAIRRMLPPGPRFVADQLDDGPTRAEGVDPTDSPLDFLPYTEAASLGAKGARALMADELGGIKSPWENLRRALHGADPLAMSPKEYGRYADRLGPDLRSTAIELAGAQSRDEFQTADPRQIIQRLAKVEGVEPPTVALGDDLSKSGYYAYYDGAKHHVAIDRNFTKNPEFMKGGADSLAGVATHEGLHATDPRARFHFQGNRPRPEIHFTKDTSITNKLLRDYGLLDPHEHLNLKAFSSHDSPLQSVWQYLRANPQEAQSLSPYLRAQLAESKSPEIGMGHAATDLKKALNSTRSYSKQMKQEQAMKLIEADLGQFYRQSHGNAGFRGSDPWLGQKWNSASHLPAPYNSDLEIAPFRLAKRELGAGGEVDGGWLREFPQLHDAKDSYKSAIRPGANAVVPIPEPQPPGPGRLRDAAMAGAGIGLGSVAVGQAIPRLQTNAEVERIRREHREKYGPGY